MRRQRKKVSEAIAADVAIASRRRCCLCVFLDAKDEVTQGQIAHLNRDPADSSFNNLAFLCLRHHNEFDSRPSQSKGITPTEVRRYRDALYEQYPEIHRRAEIAAAADVNELDELPELSDYESLRKQRPRELPFAPEPWHTPPWHVANRPELFAYKSWASDGICLIERIDLPDGRIVIACIQMAGNPGQSITNAVEAICFQVCEQFNIPAARLVWLEHYDDFEPDEWNLVSFKKIPPQHYFEEPAWTVMTPALWKGLWLTPKKKLSMANLDFESKLTKHFDWPTEEIRSY